MAIPHSSELPGTGWVLINTLQITEEGLMRSASCQPREKQRCNVWQDSKVSDLAYAGNQER